MLSKTIVAAALLAGSAIAQSSTALNFTYLEPSTVDPQIAASWCIGQRSGCNTLCDKNAPTNDCDATLLTYECLCEDGKAPKDLAKYMNTLPDYVCQANFGGCITAHPNDAVGQGKCKTEILPTCGTLNVTEYKSNASSDSDSSSSDTSTDEPTPTGTGGGASSDDSAKATNAPSSTDKNAPAAESSSAAMALVNGKDFGVGLIAAGVFAAFGYML